MARGSLYSSSRRPAGSAPRDLASGTAQPPQDQAVAQAATTHLQRSARSERLHKLGLVLAGAAFAMAAVVSYVEFRPGGQHLTQEDIDLAVLHTLETKSLPSKPAMAYSIIAPSVVRVRQLETDEDREAHAKAKAEKDKGAKSKTDPKGKAAPKGKADLQAQADKPKAEDKTAEAKPGGPDAKTEKAEEIEDAVGTGVVIQDDGKILTALHVVAGAKRIGVIFADGTESEAELVGAQPENDIAVLQAKTLPDDLQPATLRAIKGLRPGDEVMAVGYPFGVGPSLSAGVISGFGREYTPSTNDHPMKNLIQFDTAANPGNSGGPLITDEGEVVGIVTAILNPTDEAFFVGIGFAVPIENAASGVGISPY